jgi:hypothetical protein
MTKLRRLSIVLAGCILATGFTAGASAQSRMEREWGATRDWRERNLDPDYGRGWGDRGRGRDRDWDQGRRWRPRERDCYLETRRFRNRYGETIVRRYRVCED